jgi:hypothetical protein
VQEQYWERSDPKELSGLARHLPEFAHGLEKLAGRKRAKE